ncbi:hypothetical protein DV454_000639 [Geotrichum candidum]|nr:hypothetical protein DV454_000639 [Geotrichum candidum]
MNNLHSLLRKRQGEAVPEVDAALSTMNLADTTFILLCTFLVFIITPGIGMFYGGMLRRKNILTILFQTYAITAVITIQWYLMGYSLATSPTGGVFYGNFRYGALQNMNEEPMLQGDGTIPEMLYWAFSCFFPVCTVQIFVGAIAERGRLLPSLVVGFIWVTIVYCPLAYWSWGGDGWLAELGSLDFAGGGPVHIASGVAALSYSLFIGKRKDLVDIDGKKKLPKFRPKDPFMVFLGATLIWFGWLAFNSGTLIAVNVRTAYILTNTHLAACVGVTVWITLDRVLTGRFSIVGACEGAIAGLVAITPSCGYVEPWAAFICAAITAAVCRLSHNFNNWVGIDDTIEAFNLHGLGGIVGGILLAFFASPRVSSLDGSDPIDGGWVAHHWIQLGYQLADICSVTAWSFVLTYVICFCVNFIPGLHLRVSPEEEEAGMDLLEIHEIGGVYDEEPGFPQIYGQDSGTGTAVGGSIANSATGVDSAQKV